MVPPQWQHGPGVFHLVLGIVRVCVSVSALFTPREKLVPLVLRLGNLGGVVYLENPDLGQNELG